MTNDAGQLERVFAEIERLRGDLVEAVSGAVQIESVNPKYPGQVYDEVVGGEGEASKYVARTTRRSAARSTSSRSSRTRERGRRAARPGGGRSLIFNGHVDVVPPGDPANWTSGDPFSGRVDDDRIWGRGSTDMKGGILAQAFAAQAIRDAGRAAAGRPHPRGRRRRGGHGPRAAARPPSSTAATAPTPRSSPSPARPRPRSPSCRSRPGLWWFSVTVRGKATHASMRGETFRAGGRGAAVGVNAIDKGIQIFQAIRQLEDTWGLTKRHPLFAPGPLHDPPRRRHGRPERRAGAVRHLRVHDLRVLRLVPPRGRPGRRAGARSRSTSPRAAQLDPWLREHPPELEWKLNWPASVVDPDAPHRRHRAQAVERATAGTRLAGPATVQGLRGRGGHLVAQREGHPGHLLRRRRPARGARRRRARADRRAAWRRAAPTPPPRWTGAAGASSACWPRRRRPPSSRPRRRASWPAARRRGARSSPAAGGRPMRPSCCSPSGPSTATSPAPPHPSRRCAGPAAARRRRLDRARRQPRRPRARAAAERPRGRPQPQLPRPLARERPARRSLLARAGRRLGARDARAHAARAAPAARPDDPLPPAVRHRRARRAASISRSPAATPSAPACRCARCRPTAAPSRAGRTAATRAARWSWSSARGRSATAPPTATRPPRCGGAAPRFARVLTRRRRSWQDPAMALWRDLLGRWEPDRGASGHCPMSL